MGINPASVGWRGKEVILSNVFLRSSELIGTLTTFSFEPFHRLFGRVWIFTKRIFLLQRTDSNSVSWRSSGIGSISRPFLKQSGGIFPFTRYFLQVLQRYSRFLVVFSIPRNCRILVLLSLIFETLPSNHKRLQEAHTKDRPFLWSLRNALRRPKAVWFFNRCALAACTRGSWFALYLAWFLRICSLCSALYLAWFLRICSWFSAL